MPLSDITIKNAKPREKAYRLFDTGGLYLEVAPSGGKWWRIKFRHEGKEKRLSLGTYPDVPLKQARERRDELRQQNASGIDPAEKRKSDKLKAKHAAGNTFHAIATAWLAHNSAKWKEQTRTNVWSSLEREVLPTLGARPIDSIKAREVALLVKGIDAKGTGETASRVLQRVKQIFRYAVIHDHLQANPVSELMPSELLQPRKVKHRAALPQAELSGFLAKLDAYQGDPCTTLAMRLLLLTAMRPGEVRGAMWSEFDLEAKLWRIPGARMKMGEEHLVPLSTQALAVLAEAEKLKDGSGLVFPSPYYPNKPLSENTLNSALANMGYKGIATAHGFRSLFSTVANEIGHRSDVIERHLDHTERNDVRAAYNRANYLKERQELVQWWGSFVGGVG